ncbi:hypothetical protein M5689_020971 [Euphorbia peplus]|nr:hypothetical protein M5689_020971 [Euphorbia peplus]
MSKRVAHESGTGSVLLINGPPSTNTSIQASHQAPPPLFTELRQPSNRAHYKIVGAATLVRDFLLIRFSINGLNIPRGACSSLFLGSRRSVPIPPPCGNNVYHLHLNRLMY